MASRHDGVMALRRAPENLLVHLRRARDHTDRHFTEPLDLATVSA